MGKTVVIYKSKYGSTKQYAQWIATTLDCPLFESKNFPIEQLNDYSTIVFGAGIYANKINGIDFLTKNAEALKDKKLIMFTCGFADPTQEGNLQVLQSVVAKSLPVQLAEKTQVFHLRGALGRKGLKTFDKAAITMLIRMLKQRGEANLNTEEQLMLETATKKIDFVDKGTIGPIVLAAKA